MYAVAGGAARTWRIGGPGRHGQRQRCRKPPSYGFFRHSWRVSSDPIAFETET